MKITGKIFAVAAAALLFAASLSAQNAEGSIERYALYVASNKGGEGRETLRYAGSDAQTLASTMIEIGGVKKQNSFILVDSSKDEIDGAFDNITSIIERNAKNAKRTEFLFYYSGHSDEDALLLGNETYNYSELKAAITAIPSDVHVVMLDSCFSGNFIRAKGGSREKSFLVDDSAVVQGHAYFSSSSESEASQESDTIGASYFTHSIVTGLRGAADTSGDDKVSLNELYYYAFNDTLSQTETSQIGAQHPSYNITMVGSGDLILTDISVADSVLAIPAEASGQFLVRNIEGKLVSEINKLSGSQMSIALPVGMYTVTVNSGASTSQATVQLTRGQTTVLSTAGMRQIQQTQGVARGSAQVMNAPTVTVQVNSYSRTYGYEGEYNEYNDPYLQNGAYPSPAYPAVSSGEIREKLEIETADGPYFPLVVSIVPGVNIPGVSNANFVLSPFMSEMDNVEGIQAASFMNILNNSLMGFQTAGFMNILRGSGTGIQGAGFMNIVKGRFQGIEGAGFMNIVNNGFQGIEGAGFMNVVKNGLQGVQLAGFSNVAHGNSQGIQIAGFLNVADYFTGLQIGVINVAKENNGVALGLLNFIGNGIKAPALYWDFLPGTNQIWCQFQNGTKHLYTTWLAGTEAGFDGNYAVVGGGIGCRIGENGFSLDFELLSRQIITSSSKQLITNLGKVFGGQFGSFPGIDMMYPTVRASLNLGNRNKFTLFTAYSADLMVDGWNNAAFDVWEASKIYEKTIGGKQCKIRTTWSFGFKF